MNFSDFKNSSSLLSTEQMKNVKGGNPLGGNCGYMNRNGEWTEVATGGNTKTAAMMYASEEHTYRWCCDSCPWN